MVSFYRHQADYPRYIRNYSSRIIRRTLVEPRAHIRVWMYEASVKLLSLHVLINTLSMFRLFPVGAMETEKGTDEIYTRDDNGTALRAQEPENYSSVLSISAVVCRWRRWPCNWRPIYLSLVRTYISCTFARCLDKCSSSLIKCALRRPSCLSSR